MKKRMSKKRIIYGVLFVGIVTCITVMSFPYLKKLSDPLYQEEIRKYMENTGHTGILFILGLQILQIIIAWIPGEPVELLSGALFGTFGGVLLCLIGCVIASTITFSLSKRFGKRLLYAIFKKEKVQTWKWLQDSKKCSMVTFLLFFIPGTPKDMLTYIVGITDMNTSKFIVISTLARIPSVISSTIIGSTMQQGKWKISVIVFFITGIIGIIGIVFHDKMIAFCKRH